MTTTTEATDLGPVVAFRACSIYLRHGALITVESRHTGGTWHREPHTCPYHGGVDCIETYHAAGHMPRTLAGWWRWLRVAGGRR